MHRNLIFIQVLSLWLTLGQVPSTPAAFAEISGSHGGDPCEQQFKDISSTFLQWVKGHGPNNLHLPDGVYAKQFRAQLVDAISNYLDETAEPRFAFSCVTDPVVVEGEEKTCAWTSPADNPKILDGKTHIVCNFDRFQKGNGGTPAVVAAFQYRQTIHEWAGITGFEKNNGSTSDYSITDQITAKGAWAQVYQLDVTTDTQVETQVGMSYQNKTHNADGSVTFDGLRVQFQNRNFRISAETSLKDSSYGNACRALGYETALEDVSDFTRISFSPEDAILLDQEGYVIGVGFHQLTFDHAVCANPKSLGTVLRYNITKSKDSALLTDLRLNHGGDELKIIEATRQASLAVCKRAGYSQFLSAQVSRSLLSHEMTYSAKLNSKGNLAKVVQMNPTELISLECK